jgi:hypothetical protein
MYLHKLLMYICISCTDEFNYICKFLVNVFYHRGFYSEGEGGGMKNVVKIGERFDNKGRNEVKLGGGWSGFKGGVGEFVKVGERVKTDERELWAKPIVNPTAKKPHYTLPTFNHEHYDRKEGFSASSSGNHIFICMY